MNTEIKKVLDAEILDEIDRLGGFEVGSDEYKTCTDGLVKLMDRAIEMDKLEAEREEKAKARNQDAELKNKQLMEQIKAREIDTEIRNKQLDEQKRSREDDNFHKNSQLAEERRSRLINTILTAGLGAVNILVLIWGTKTSLKFEETGTITTHAGRNFISKLFRK
jgi:hypothetical protein